jgi:hypothetical protein
MMERGVRGEVKAWEVSLSLTEVIMNYDRIIEKKTIFRYI